MQIRKAGEFSLSELTRLFNQGYTRSFHPLTFTEEQLARHLECGPVDMDRSLVGVVDGRPAAFSYLATLGERGWIGGFGVAPEFRGRGLSHLLMAEHARWFRPWGLTHVQLEVFEHNWATRVYERVGFRATRRLPLLIATAPETPARETGEALPAVAVDDALAHHARLHRGAPPCWNREARWLACMLGEGNRAILSGPSEHPDGFLLLARQPERVRISDAAAESEAAAARLAAALGALHPGERLMLVNEPEGSPIHRGFLAAGWEEESIQLEMHWDASQA